MTAVEALAEALGWDWPSDYLVPSSQQCVEDVLRDLHDLGYDVVPVSS